MKKISCHYLFFKVLCFFFIVFGFWCLYINLRENKDKTFLLFPIIFIVIFLILFIQICKRIYIDENIIIYRNVFFQKRTIKIQEIKDILFSRANAEKYVEIKGNEKNIKIEYTNKKVEKEFRDILQKILTYQHNEE